MDNILFLITGLILGIVTGIYLISLWYINDDDKYHLWKHRIDKFKDKYM